MPDLTHLEEKLQRARVLVVGDAMLDRYLFGDVERISPEAPVPVVRVTREEARLGGAANVALNVKSVGAHVTLITVVGSDEPATRLQQLLQEKGIEAILGRDPNLYTCVKLRVIGRAQQLVRVDFENQPDHEILGDMLADYARVLPQHDAVLFSDYGKGGLAHIPRMIELARAAGKPVLVDPKGTDYTRYTGATVITPNRSELSQVIGGWTSEEQLQTRAQALRESLHLDSLLLTRSEEGMSLYDATGQTRVAAQAREVFDVTGAGDTVIAIMAAMLACGLTLREALPIANRAAGLVVGKFGTATVSYRELFP
ncbi:MAG TPA: D-glycero-beta-D-manno-heptose-7-phosphate kinase [Steroidobacteraceae bacterium]|nr:D-glycero-beta-D-manno-heptose-7-phosphate kinase [Steroidobacteraceae bacterium]